MVNLICMTWLCALQCKGKTTLRQLAFDKLGKCWVDDENVCLIYNCVMGPMSTCIMRHAPLLIFT